MDDLGEIQQLYARYAWAMDEGQFEQWLQLFTDDAVIEGPTFGRYQGREDLKRFVAKYKLANGMFQVRHMLSNLLVEIEGDNAAGRCYVAHYRTHRGRTELNGMGGYRDRLRKVDGKWLFAERQAFFDYSGTWT